MKLEQRFAPYAPPENHLVEALTYWAREKPQETAFYYLVDGDDDEARVSYERLDRKARAIAQRLRSLNMEGERALLLFPPGLDFVAAFFGCLYAGVTAVPAYPPRRNRNTVRILSISNDAEAKVAFSVNSVIDRIQGLLDETPELKKLVWLSTDKIDEAEADGWWMPDLNGDDTAFLQYTSGSTGEPKGVMISHANIMHNVALIAMGFGYDRNGSGMTWLPTYHDMGLIGGVLCPVYFGCSNVLMSPMAFLQKPFRWLQAVSRYKVTISGGPNFGYDLCVQRVTPEQIAELDLSSWAVAFNGAEPVRPQTIDKFSKMFEPCGFRREAFYPCYGMAETTLIVSGGDSTALPVMRTFDGKALDDHRVVAVEPSDDGARTLVGSGKALCDGQVVIVDPDTHKETAEGHVGEIWVGSDSVGKGYRNRPNLTDEMFRATLADTGQGPFLRTGDLGFVDDGELFVTGRLKDLIIVRGVNRYPQDIESTVERVSDRLRPGASAAIAVDVADRERLIIVAEVTRGRHDKPWSEVIESIRRVVALEHDLPPDGVILVRAGSIPKTSSGKIQRHACRYGFIEGSLSGVAQWCSWVADEEAAGRADVDIAARAEVARRKRRVEFEDVDPKVLESVLEHIRAVAKERARGMTPETNVVAMGLDSLERMEIVASIEETFGGRFPEDVLLQVETPLEVTGAVQKYLGTELRDRVKRPADVDVPLEDYRFDKMPEYVKLRQMKSLLTASGAPDPYHHVCEGIAGDTVVVDGRELINFSSFNYLGLSGHPILQKAAKDAVDRFGTSVSASRLVSGEKTLHGQLERAICDFVGAEASITFPSGHATNETTIGHLFGPGDLILHDALDHNSLIQGAILSGARRRPFPHNDAEALDRLLGELRADYRRVLVVVEGVYSMDGDFPELPKFIELKKRHKAFLMVDEAHSLGTMGESGRGLCEHFGADPADVDILMGTLGKGIGGMGGYIAGGKELVEYLRYTSPGFVFATGMSPADAGASLAGFNVLAQHPELVAQLRDRSHLLLQLARERGMNTGTSSGTPVVPIIIGNSRHALLASARMIERGVNVHPILHPAVEESASRLRFFVSATHTERQIRATIDTLADVLAELDPAYVDGGVPKGV